MEREPAGAVDDHAGRRGYWLRLMRLRTQPVPASRCRRAGGAGWHRGSLARAAAVRLSLDTGHRTGGRTRGPVMVAGSRRDRVMAACGAKPGAAEDYPFGNEVAVFKVAGKMFALVSLGPAVFAIFVTGHHRSQADGIRPGGGGSPRCDGDPASACGPQWSCSESATGTCRSGSAGSWAPEGELCRGEAPASDHLHHHYRRRHRSSLGSLSPRRVQRRHPGRCAE
jgi:hypothetical protein